MIDFYAGKVELFRDPAFFLRMGSGRFFYVGAYNDCNAFGYGIDCPPWGDGADHGLDGNGGSVHNGNNSRRRSKLL